MEVMRMRASRSRLAWLLGAASALALATAHTDGAAPVPATDGRSIRVPAQIATIQGAIDIASRGAVVVVGPGRYHEHIDFKGKAIEVRSSVGPARTVIDGDGSAVVAVFRSGETRQSVLRGFTITHGAIPPEGGTAVIAGAGVGINGASLTIVGNVVTDNDAGDHAGAGIGVSAGSPLIRDNRIVGNHTGLDGAGGGIIAGEGTEIVGNHIEGNRSGGGGGLVIYNGATVVRGNVIQGNPSARSGGGVAFLGDGGVFEQNLIAGNTAAVSGGGVYWEGDAIARAPDLSTDAVARNQAPRGANVAWATA